MCEFIEGCKVDGAERGQSVEERECARNPSGSYYDESQGYRLSVGNLCNADSGVDKRGRKVDCVYEYPGPDSSRDDGDGGGGGGTVIAILFVLLLVGLLAFVVVVRFTQKPAAVYERLPAFLRGGSGSGSKAQGYAPVQINDDSADREPMLAAADSLFDDDDFDD